MQLQSANFVFICESPYIEKSDRDFVEGAMKGVRIFITFVSD